MNFLLVGITMLTSVAAMAGDVGLLEKKSRDFIEELKKETAYRSESRCLDARLIEARQSIADPNYVLVRAGEGSFSSDGEFSCLPRANCWWITAAIRISSYESRQSACDYIAHTHDKYFDLIPQMEGNEWDGMDGQSKVWKYSDAFSGKRF